MENKDLELRKHLESGVYAYGVVSGEDDGVFYPAYYSKLTGKATTIIDPLTMFRSREAATDYAKLAAKEHIYNFVRNGE